MTKYERIEGFQSMISTVLNGKPSDALIELNGLTNYLEQVVEGLKKNIDMKTNYQKERSNGQMIIDDLINKRKDN